MEFVTYEKFPEKVMFGWSSLKTQIPLTPSRYYLGVFGKNYQIGFKKCFHL